MVFIRKRSSGWGTRAITNFTRQAAIPIYSAWLAYSTFGNVKQMLGAGGAEALQDGTSSAATGSKRQQKMEKRGGQKVQYR